MVGGGGQELVNTNVVAVDSPIHRHQPEYLINLKYCFIGGCDDIYAATLSIQPYQCNHLCSARIFCGIQHNITFYLCQTVSFLCKSNKVKDREKL